MGKLTAYIVGLFSALALSYYVLSPYYSPLIAWVGPIFGAPLIFVLSIMFLVLGDVLNHLILIPILIVIGVLIGLAARKGTRAISAAFTVYLSLYGFILSSLFTLYLTSKSKFTSLISSVGSSSISNSLPSPPPGTNFGTIMGEPLFSRIALTIEKIGETSLSSSLGSSGTSGLSSSGFVIVAGGAQQSILNLGGGIFGTLVEAFLPFIIVNLVILMLSSGLTGRFLYRRIHKDKIGKKVKKKGKSREAIVFILLALFVLSFAGAFSPYSATTGQQNIHYENGLYPFASPEHSISGTGIFSTARMVTGISSHNDHQFSVTGNNSNQDILSAGVIGLQGSSYNIFLNMALYNGNSNSNWIYSSGQTTSIFTLVAETDNLPQLFRSVENGLGVSNTISNSSIASSTLWNLMPQSVIVMAYNGTLANTSSSATTQVGNIMSQLGGSDGACIVRISLGTSFIGLTDSNVSLYIYTFTTDQFSSENSMVKDLSGTISNSGSNQIFTSGINSGYLVPGYTSGSVDSSIFIAGFVHSGIFSNEISKYLGINSTLSKGSSIVFDGGLFAKSRVVTSSSDIHMISGAQIYGYDGTIAFSSSSVNYGMLLGVPEGNTSANFTEIGSYTGSSSQQTSNVNQTIQPTGPFSLTSIMMKSNHLYPANLQITTSITSSGTNDFIVKTTVMNRDSNSITSVAINESSFATQYNGIATVTSGKLVSSIPLLSPGQSFSNTFTFTTSNPGFYSISQPSITYSMNGTSFTNYGTSTGASGPTPLVVTSINGVWFNSVNESQKFLGITFLTNQILPGFYLFDLIILLIIIADISLEVKSYKEWKREKAQSAQSAQSQPPPKP